MSGMDKQVTITSQQNMYMCPLLGYRGNSHTKTTEQKAKQEAKRILQWTESHKTAETFNLPKHIDHDGAKCISLNTHFH